MPAYRSEVVGSWWSPSTPDDVRAAQSRVSAARMALDIGLQSQPPRTGDPALIDAAYRAWNALDTQIASYTSEEPSIFWWTRDDQVQRGRAYEQQIEQWRQKFLAMGAGVPSSPPTPLVTAPTGDLLSSLGGIGETVKWLAIAYVAAQFLGGRR